MTALDLKEQGNRLFSGRHYDDAAQCYTKAIVSSDVIIDVDELYGLNSIEWVGWFLHSVG